MNRKRQTGRCGCGEVVFHIEGELTNVTACHCHTCRRLSGYVWAATHADRTAVTIEHDRTLTWWASSDQAERGFCRRCGSSLFYRRHDLDRVSIAPGALDQPTGLSTTTHICCAEAGDYYRIVDEALRIDGPVGDGD